MKAIFVLSVRALSGWKRLLLLCLLMLVPVGLALTFALSETAEDGSRFAIELFDNFVLPVVLPIADLIVATSALGHEVEDHTLVYLTLRPIARTAIVIAKYVAAAVIVIPLVEISVVTMGEIASRKAAPPQDLALLAVDTGNTAASLLLAGFGGAAAYLALFLLLGLLMPQRALLVGFVYVLLWEGIAAGLSTALSTLSVRRYVQGVLDTHLSNGALAQVASSTLSAGGSALGLLIVVGGALSLTTWRLRRMQLL